MDLLTALTRAIETYGKPEPGQTLYGYNDAGECVTTVTFGEPQPAPEPLFDIQRTKIQTESAVK